MGRTIPGYQRRMGAGSIFVLLVVVVAVVVIAVVFFGFGASQWKRQTDPPKEEGADGERRPTHKVLDEQGNLVGTEHDDTPRERSP